MNQDKLKRLMCRSSKNQVFTSKKLLELGYSRSLQHRYLKSGWLKTVGAGAFCVLGAEVSVYSGVKALQDEYGLDVHIGGKTALELNGLAHYLMLSDKSKIQVFSRRPLPKWFKNYQWKDSELEVINTKFLNTDAGLIEKTLEGVSFKISNPARAILEILYQAKTDEDYSAAYEALENLTGLRPSVVNELLMNCNSIKVKRLFLLFSESLNHSWLKGVNKEEVDLGNGKRSLVKDGKLNKKYQITMPKSLEL